MPFGVKQGDLLSSSLFAFYINNLAQEIKQGNLGVQIEDMDFSILLFADDIVLIAENEVNLQNMLNIMSSWCCNCKWRLTINNEKKHKLFNLGKKLITEYSYISVWP